MALTAAKKRADAERLSQPIIKKLSVILSEIALCQAEKCEWLNVSSFHSRALIKFGSGLSGAIKNNFNPHRKSPCINSAADNYDSM